MTEKCACDSEVCVDNFCPTKDSRNTQISVECDVTLLTSGDGSDPSTLGYDEWHGTSLVTASEQSAKLCDGNETVLKEPTEGAKFLHWSGRCAYGRCRNSVFDYKRRRCVGRRALEVAAKHPTRTLVPLVSKYSETRKSPKRFKTKERQRWR